jgi:Tfp pilus assembly protein FimT
VVTAIILMTIAAIGIYQLRPTWQDQEANAGMDQVKSTLRQARETAVAQRRSIVVKFATAGTSPCTGTGTSNCIELYEMVVSGTTQTQAGEPVPHHNDRERCFVRHLHRRDGIRQTPSGFPAAAA